MARTTEKVRISDLCSNGLYYFSSVSLFEESFKLFANQTDIKELFVAPIYNVLIRKGLRVKYILLEKNQTLFAGTPSEYETLKTFF